MIKKFYCINPDCPLKDGMFKRDYPKVKTQKYCSRECASTSPIRKHNHQMLMAHRPI